ncbi:thiosulfate sulfurtransferase 16, chloroplastic-like [Phalaenopsis equestris]|uniref:thiosulfate sulfurtransferase 16, chloroplastic-like n=1 Tax=Phalaenopsis equestris TaxID=78828 RepID=UPI0009E1E247|nr:thiosulfate sulfurtransferase 16, chloroplastic-like [Phalaenopsis equestris]
MAVLTIFSFPITSPTPSVKRFHLSPPARLSSSNQFSHRRIVRRLQNRRRSFVWSMFTDEEQGTVVPASVPVRVAYELLQAGHRYLDVRTVDEFKAGHVVGATNIPFMLTVGSGMTKNQNFLDEVSNIFGKDDEILIGCLSGKRSLMAASELSSAV